MVIMVYPWRYVTPRPCDFHLFSFQKTNWNEKKNKQEKKKNQKQKQNLSEKLKFNLLK